MKECELKTYRVEEINFVNKLSGAAKLELSHKYSYNVGYSNNNTCRGEFKAEIADKNHSQNFSITIVMSAIFTIEPGIEKEIIHLRSYDMMFPYVKAAVSNLTVNAGIPPVFIPYIDISDKNIYRVELPKKPDNQ